MDDAPAMPRRVESPINSSSRDTSQ